MNQIKIEIPKIPTTLPAHETATRRARAQMLPFPRKPSPATAPARPADFHRKPNLLDPF